MDKCPNVILFVEEGFYTTDQSKKRKGRLRPPLVVAPTPVEQVATASFTYIIEQIADAQFTYTITQEANAQFSYLVQQTITANFTYVIEQVVNANFTYITE